MERYNGGRQVRIQTIPQLNMACSLIVSKQAPYKLFSRRRTPAFIFFERDMTREEFIEKIKSMTFDELEDLVLESTD